jgi:hypothetical protein
MKHQILHKISLSNTLSRPRSMSPSTRSQWLRSTLHMITAIIAPPGTRTARITYNHVLFTRWLHSPQSTLFPPNYWQHCWRAYKRLFASSVPTDYLLAVHNILSGELLSGLENRDYRHRVPSHWPRGTLYPQKLALTSPTSGGRSVGIVRPRTQTTEFVFVANYLIREYVKNIAAGFTSRNHLCGLVVRVPGYRFRGPGFDSRALQKK